MSKSNCFALWEGALQRMELPPVIGELNEPQYVSLVFDNFCSVRVLVRWITSLTMLTRFLSTAEMKRKPTSCGRFV